jgi:hypothetical protein
VTTSQRFRRHLESALEAGYKFVPASEIADGRAPVNSLAITFDDGIRSAATTAAPVLAELGIPWTLFIVSGWADGDARDWAILAEWFLRRFSLLDSLYMVPSARIIGRTVRHNMRCWLAERREKRAEARRQRNDYLVSARSRSGSR